MTQKTIIVLGGDMNIFHQLLRLVPQFRFIPIVPKQRLEEVIQFKPGLVLLLSTKTTDQHLEWIKELRSTHPRKPIILLNTEKDASFIGLAEAFQIGLSEYLEWPISAELLQQKIEQHYRTQSWWSQFIELFKELLFLKQFNQSNYALGILPPQLSHLSFKEAEHNSHMIKTDIYAHFFGNFRLFIKGNPLPDLNSTRIISLLTYFLAHPKQHFHKEKLMEAFWPNIPAESSRNSLNVALSQIRRYLRPYLKNTDFILYKNEGYILNPELTISSDISQFDSLCKSGQQAFETNQLERAIQYMEQARLFYQADFISQLPYENWCEKERDALKEKLICLLQNLAQAYYQKKAFHQVLPLAELILEKDPYLEDAHRLLMDCFARLNQRSRALQQYHKCRKVLKAQFGAKPSQETEALFKELKMGHIKTRYFQIS